MKKKIIISGGGTGGHIFPAIAIANALKQIDSNIEILFVGAEGKMEMEKVPAAGYKIIGLPVVGLRRKVSFQIFAFFIKLLRSILKSKKTVIDFKPDAVVGVGGYASGPLLYAATGYGIPALIQEQNSFAGITNKLLAKRASIICVAYENMERFFPKEKIKITGNPVRKDLIEIKYAMNKPEFIQEAYNHFQLNEQKQTILIFGGSLGARTINNSVVEQFDTIQKNNDIQIIWQCGKLYYEEMQQKLNAREAGNIKLHEFIARMDYAYSVANVIIARAGAITVSELCIVAKPAILVPSPNVAEDHQTKNAMALVEKNAAIMVKDSNAPDEMIKQAIALLNNTEKKQQLAKNINGFAKPQSTQDIANEVLKLINKK